MTRRLYPLFIISVLLSAVFNAQCQVDTAEVIVANVSCNGGHNGSILYNITGGPGPVKYSWSNGVTGYATGSCTYAVSLNNPGAALSQFQVQVNVNLATGMNANFSNIAFLDSAGNLFPFWLTDYPTASAASFWVRVPNIPPGHSVFYLSFCGTSTTSQSNPNTTFEFFENFDGGSLAAYTSTCLAIDNTGESCSSGLSTAQFFSPGYSLDLKAASSCFSAPFDGAGSQVSRTVPMVNDSLVIDFEDKAAVTLYGFCSGGTSTTNAVLADNVNLNGGQGAGQGGSCATNTSAWRSETSLPFAVTTGTTKIGIQTTGGDCDNSEGWFDDVRVRKYRAHPPVDTLLITPQLALDSLTAGTYTLTLTDINGNSVTRTIIITQPSPIALIVDSNNNACQGAGNGVAWATVSNGSAPYQLLWSNSQTTDTIRNLAAGTYTLTVTDNNGCSISDSTHILQFPVLQGQAFNDSVSCFGAATGTAWVVITGGLSPYAYIWSNTGTTDTISNLTAGTYSVIVQDANSCTVSSSVTVNQPASALSVTSSSSPITCFGYTNGKARVTATGGTSPYFYTWSNTTTTDSISNLGAGTYTVTVADNAGCTATASSTISPAPSQLTLSFDSTNVLCFGSSTGSATAVISGGTTPYTLLWSNQSNAVALNNLPAGAYSLAVTDSFGCSVAGSVNITQPQKLIVTTSAHSPLCAGDNSGTIATVVTGGVSPYSYSWSNNANTDSISGLAAGTYAVTVTDSHLCTATKQTSIAPTVLIAITQQQITPACVDSSIGAISIQVSGGNSPYTYLWSNGSTVQDLTGLGTGPESVTVTDGSGCTATFTATVPLANFSVGITAQPDSVILYGDNVTLTVTGNNLASAIWQPGSSLIDAVGLSVTASPLTNTIYNVTATSTDGCKASSSIKIVVNQKAQWLIPTGFSPNGDGVNDYFHVILRGPVQLIALSVFDRWGEKIFESNSEPGWDGTFKGMAQPIGVYTYTVQVKNLQNGDNSITTESGNVTLIR